MDGKSFRRTVCALFCFGAAALPGLTMAPPARAQHVHIHAQGLHAQGLHSRGLHALAGQDGDHRHRSRTATGEASWYGGQFDGRRTASGQILNPASRTAAHRSLSFGTRVRVTNLRNGRVCVVTVNDRGPYVPGRIIDLSEGAARDLGMVEDGVTPVRLEVLGRG